ILFLSSFLLILLTLSFFHALFCSLFFSIDKRKRWAEARNYCTTYYTDIISIRSTVENIFVSRLFSKETPLWLGLYKNNNTTTMWEWINGDKFIYTHWKDKEPNAQPGSVICVAMSNGQWFDNYCNQTYRFVCYKDRGYHLIDQKKSWFEARNHCRKQHTDLASIRNPEELEVFTSMFDRDVTLWIGLYNANRSEIGWKWINGDNFSYTHWKEKEPNGYQGAMICVAMRNGMWFDDYCNHTYRFMCYKGKIGKVNQKKSWTEARDYCRNFYTDLISIRSPQEQKRTAKLFTGDTPLWIGLYNNNKRPTAGWKWINGDKFNNDQWRHAELDNSGPRICMAFFQWVIIPSKNNNNLVI
uniref:C-type lectin domain-containing protein n=1 Tax=Callorhinchus milii TaxID=7868 RepID=A0A4W3IDK8_CALMI